MDNHKQEWTFSISEKHGTYVVTNSSNTKMLKYKNIDYDAIRNMLNKIEKNEVSICAYVHSEPFIVDPCMTCPVIHNGKIVVYKEHNDYYINYECRNECGELIKEFSSENSIQKDNLVDIFTKILEHKKVLDLEQTELEQREREIDTFFVEQEDIINAIRRTYIDIRKKMTDAYGTPKFAELTTALADFNTKLRECRNAKKMTEPTQLYGKLEDHKKLCWSLEIDKDKYILSNSIDTIILDKKCVDYNMIDIMLKKMPTDGAIWIYSERHEYSTYSDPEEYYINLSIYAEEDNYYFKYEFCDISYDVDKKINELLPTYPIDKSRIVVIFSEILEHKKLLDHKQNKINDIEFKAQIEKQEKVIKMIAFKYEQFKRKQPSREQLDDLEYGLDACLTKLS